jgi:LPS sulfotransferase NodH
MRDVDHEVGAGTAEARRGYAVCTTPRSGSNFLGQVLASTGGLGVPLEYFNGSARRALEQPGYPDDSRLQLRAVLDLGGTPNGIYAVKVFPHQLRRVTAARWTEALPALSFVHLTRGDVLGQALSHARALQTGQYRSTSAPGPTPRYDAPLVRRCLAAAVAEDARWRLWFARNGIEPLHLRYEDVVAHPQQAADAVADFLGLREKFPVVSEGVGLRVQRDQETERWRQRFLEETSDRDTIEPEYGRYGVISGSRVFPSPHRCGWLRRLAVLPTEVGDATTRGFGSVT